MSSYRDLRVRAEGMALAEMCYRVTSTFPGVEALRDDFAGSQGCPFDFGERSGRLRA
jgi:hypothetical protein